MTNNFTRKRPLVLLSALSLLFLTSCQNENAATSAPKPDNEPTGKPEQPIKTSKTRPNILLIIADDLGYTDLGVYGSEIATPNLDALAQKGLILTEFHTQAVCAPTRASLLSGLDNHRAGGAMHVYDVQKGTPSYQGGLRRDIVPLPAILSANGYQTYFAGKWHLGVEPDRLPNARGFDRSIALKEGGASHFNDMRGIHEWDREAHYFINDEPVDQLPDDFYSSKDYTDFIINSINDDNDSKSPWYAQLAFTAPHWPLQAPQEYIDKYKGRYDAGYEVIREERIKRAKSLGVIPNDAPTYPLPKETVPWDSLSPEEKAESAKTMEVYAAMVEALDANVGRLIDYLKDTDQFENTLVFFISDNGAEGQSRPGGDNGADWTFDNSLENMGLINSHIYYGPAWAAVSSGVLRRHKSVASGGGVRAPAFVYHPELTKKAQISDQFVSVVDFAPTILDFAGIDSRAQVNGRDVQAFQGQSMGRFLFTDADDHYPEEFTYGWEVFGHLALRKGNWKLQMLVTPSAERRQLPPLEANQWQLFNVKQDPGESNDLSADHPEIVSDLLREWDAYVAANDIILPETHPSKTAL